MAPRRRRRSEGEDVAGSNVVVAGEKGHAAVERGGGRIIGRVSRRDVVAMRGCGRHDGGRDRKRAGREGGAHVEALVL